jgi:hypothetical protein
MHIPKKYFHDRVILLLISTTVFLALLQMILVLLGMSSGNRLNLVGYRPNLGLSAYSYETSSLSYISFIIFGFLVAGVHIVLSIKTYLIRRYYALTILGMGVLLIVLSIIVSNALLIRR